jgi:hypothetical protein
LAPLRDCAHHRLGVEAPEILERAAAAHEQHEIDVGAARDRSQRGCDLELGAGALHAGGRDQQRRGRRAAPAHLDHVADRGAAGRGDDADAPRMLGQRLLARFVEQALGLEATAQLLERELERTFAARLDLAHDQLQLTARLVDRRLGQQQQLEAVLELERQARGVAAKQRAADLPVRVLEREVVVPGAGDEQVARLAGDPDAADRVLDQRAQPAQQVADAVDAPRGRGRRGLRLGHALFERQLGVIHYSVAEGASAAMIGVVSSERSRSK